MTLPTKLSNQKKANEIVRRVSEALLCTVIADTRRKKVRLESEINTSSAKLRELMNEEQWSKIDKWSEEAATEASSQAKAK